VLRPRQCGRRRGAGGPALWRVRRRSAARCRRPRRRLLAARAAGRAAGRRRVRALRRAHAGRRPGGCPPAPSGTPLGSPRSIQGLAHSCARALLARLPGSSAPCPVRGALHWAIWCTACAVHGPARLGWVQCQVVHAACAAARAAVRRRLRLPWGVHAAWRQAAGHALLGVLVLSLRPGQQHVMQGSAPPHARAPGAG